MALTDEQLEIISEALLPLFQYLEKEVICDVANRIKESLAYTRSAELKVESMQRMGYSPAKIRAAAMKMLKADKEFQKVVAENTMAHKKEVKKLLDSILGTAQEEKDGILSGSADMSYFDDLRIWEEGGKQLTDNSFLPQLVKAMQKQTGETLTNLSRTTGFKTMSGYEAMEDLYRRELDKALIKVCTGTFSREQVVHDVVHSLAVSGLRTIDFASGYSMQLDTAVRLAMRTGAHQLSAKITDGNIEQTGENLVRVSTHWGARNTGTGHANHEQWQGKVYFIREGQDYKEEARRIGQDYITDLWRATGYSVDGQHENDPAGLYGYNCRHRHYPWFLGISKFPKEDPEPQPVIINGKNYDYYAISQKQRVMERSIRALKREREALKSLNMDTKQISARIKQKIKEYEDFSDAAKVAPRHNRLRYESGTSDLRKTKAWKRFHDMNNESGGEREKVSGSSRIKESKVGKENIEITTESSKILSKDETVNKAKQLGDDILQGRETLAYDNGNVIFDYVARRLNYDALPQVVTSDIFAKMEKESPVGVLYRGISADTKEKATQYAAEFMRGKMYAGKSYVYGSGTYFSPDRSEAGKYDNQGVMLKAALSKDAKVAKYEDIIKEYSSTGADVARQKKGDNTEAWEDILSSAGEFAAIKGYDAIDMDGAFGQNHVIVLNRGKVVIEE